MHRHVMRVARKAGLAFLITHYKLHHTVLSGNAIMTPTNLTHQPRSLCGPITTEKSWVGTVLSAYIHDAFLHRYSHDRLLEVLFVSYSSVQH